jgi:hypothetical protein
VVDGVERLFADKGDGAGGESADEQAAEQARTGGDGNAVDVVPSGAGFSQGVVDYGQNDLDMAARGNFGHDAAVLFVQIDLAGDDIRERVAAVFDHRGRGFVAGGFEAKNFHNCEIVARVAGKSKGPPLAAEARERGPLREIAVVARAPRVEAWITTSGDMSVAAYAISLTKCGAGEG